MEAKEKKKYKTSVTIAARRTLCRFSCFCVFICLCGCVTTCKREIEPIFCRFLLRMKLRIGMLNTAHETIAPAEHLFGYTAHTYKHKTPNRIVNIWRTLFGGKS